MVEGWWWGRALARLGGWFLLTLCGWECWVGVVGFGFKAVLVEIVKKGCNYRRGLNRGNISSLEYISYMFNLVIAHSGESKITVRDSEWTRRVSFGYNNGNRCPSEMCNQTFLLLSSLRINPHCFPLGANSLSKYSMNNINDTPPPHI